MVIFLKKNHKNTGMHRFLESLSSTIIFIEDIKESNKYNDEVGIFGGFLPWELSRNTTIKRKYYTYCSPLGQADLSNYDFYSSEIEILFALLELIDKNEICNAITSSKSLNYRFNFIYIPPVRLKIKDVFNNERYGYGFLGNNFRKHRNVANQLAAISMLDPQEHIVVSRLSQENAEAYKWWSHFFRCEIIPTRIEEEDFFDTISKHRLNFQCGFSESFSYQALEYSLVGVPTICSKCIDWYPINELIIKNNDSIEEIVQVAQSFLYNHEFYWHVSKELKNFASHFNYENNLKVGKILEKL